MKPIYKLENWAVIYIGQDPYKAPELKVPKLVGDRTGNGDNLKSITTSCVLGKSGNYVVTNNSLYELGKSNLMYEELYPNAKERLFASLIETKYD